MSTDGISVATSTRTTCPYCGVGCGVIARGDGAVAGDPDHPANRGRLCSKGAALGETLGMDGRLLRPEIRGRRASWDAALDEVADGFARTIARHGPDSVALYVSGQLLTEDYYAANKLAKGFIGTANIDSNSRLCMASSVAGHRRAFGEDLVPGIYEDLELADLLVLVGSNTAWCHPVLYQRIQAARAARPHMRIVVIDPRRTATCQDADLHLPLRPGTDVALFTGLLAHLADTATDANAAGFAEAIETARLQTPDAANTADLCGLDERHVATFFQWFRETPRTVTMFSQGVNQASTGADKVSAIVNVHLMTGRIGKPGAGPFSVTGQPNAMGGREVGALANTLAAHLDWSRPGDVELLRSFWRSPRIPASPGLKAVDLFRAIGAGKVRAVWIIATNPAVSMPDSDAVRAALAKCDLVVVSDCVRDSDTAAFAHVLLPALGWGEKDGTVTNSERVISRQRAFLPAPDEARPDWWAIAQVAARLGHADAFAWRGPADIFREHAALSGLANAGARVFDISGLAHLSDDAYATLAPTQWPVARSGAASGGRLFGDGVYPTADSRPRMVATPFRPPSAMPTRERPMTLLTGRVRDQWHTMTRTGRVPRLLAHRAEPYLAIHPADATDLPDGTLARVATRHGVALLRVRHDTDQRRGTVFAPMHWTQTICPAGRINPAVTPAVDPESGQPELKATPASVHLYDAGWYGFLVMREALAPTLARWCCAIREAASVWRYELAGSETPAVAFAELARTLRMDGRWMRLEDTAAGRHRAALVEDGRVSACLHIGATPDLAPRAVVVDAFSSGLDASGTSWTALLAGRRPGARTADPVVCVCNGVAAGAIRASIAGGCRDLAAIGAATGAGTGCGSCRPEILGIVGAETRDEQQAVALGGRECADVVIAARPGTSLASLSRCP